MKIFNKFKSKRNQNFDTLIDNVCRAVDSDLNEFNSLVNNAMKSLDGSVKLAEYLGVPEEKILKTKEDSDNYFMN